MMRRHVLLASLLFSTLVLAAPGPARADDAAVAEAQTRFNEGLSLADANRHEEARLKFQQAAAVLKAPSVLYNLARTEQLTGHDYEAIEHYKSFLRGGQNDPKVTDAMREKARQNIVDLSKKVGQIDIEAPPGARISIDGKVLDESPKEPVAVPPGKHVVEATLEGRVKSVAVECAMGVVVKAKIELDAAGTGTEPPKEGTQDPTKWYVAGAIGAAGLIGLGIGIGFGLTSQGAKSDAETIRTSNPGLCAAPALPQCAAYDSKRSDAESAATVSMVGYIGGGVLLAGAVATVALWPKSTERAAATSRKTATTKVVQPWITKDVLGAALGGSF